MKKYLDKKSESFSDWYTDVILKSKLADYSPIKGCMVIRPGGYGIWENIQRNLDFMLKEIGLENSYFPLFIPISFLKRESKHVEGFSPELAVVTHGGGEKLAEELAVRPTSETIMYEMYHKWVSSYRDLPILLNQWNNVVRWEKRTYLFLRTTEFLWQEAHTAHANKEEALKMVYEALEIYRKLLEEYLAIPVFKGLKSESEKFAGAEFTTTVEAIMPDGKSLQGGTSHNLGQNFSKKDAFDINFLDETGKTAYAWQTSFGLSTRTIGALVMVHGDDNGLVLPPRIAPVQFMIIPVENTENVLKLSQELSESLKLKDIRTTIMKDEIHSLGWKLNECELQGIPVYCAIGKKELESKQLILKIRYNGNSITTPVSGAEEVINNMLEEIQKGMFEKALKERDTLISETEDYEEFKKIMKEKRGFIKSFWCEDSECELAIKNETKASTRCLPFIDSFGNVAEENGKCIKCGRESKHRWLFAQAY